MSLTIQQCVTELLEKRTIEAMLKTASVRQRAVCTNAEIKTAIDSLSDHLQQNRHHHAVATMLALLLADADAAISKIRRQGLLRASRYDFRSGCLEKVVGAALQLVPSIQIRPERVAYLQSVQALLTIAPQARKLRESLVLRLSIRKKTVLKTLLAFVNALFSDNWMGNQHEDSDSLVHFAAEDFASAFSLLFTLFREDVGVEKEMWQHTDEHCVSPFENIYTALFLDAMRLNELRDAEIQVDGLPYKARVEGTTVVVSALDIELEKSIRLGYIQTELQVNIRAFGVARFTKERPCIREFIQQAFNAGLGEFVQLKTEPTPRLVFGIPNSPQFFEWLSTNEPYLEEVEVLLGTGIENFQPDAGASLRIGEKLTALDIVKIQRLFSFIDAAFTEKLRTFEDEHLRKVLRVNSTLPVIEHDQLMKILEVILSKEKAEEALNLLTLQGDEDYVDIQYRPFIKAGKWYAIPPAIAGKSNLTRNVIVANRLKTSATMEKDPMQEAVVRALQQAGFMVRANFEFNIDGKRETDILCWRNDELFVFECKNSYHPCSSHELRTSFEHIKTAEKQLDIRLEWLTDLDNQEKLLKWLAWNIPATQKIHTGVITANRLFTGYRLGAHPVRQAHELINVLLRGYVGRTDDKPPIRFWREDAFQAVDLVDYLQGQSIVRSQYELLRPFRKQVRIGTKSLAFERYTMDLQAAGALEQSFGVPSVSNEAAPCT